MRGEHDGDAMNQTVPSLCALTLGVVVSVTTTHAQHRGFAADSAGFYWWFDGGATIPEDGHLTEFGASSSGQTVTYDVGAGLDLAAGYAFNNYVATELQIGATWNSISSIEGAAVHDTYFSTAPILVNAVLQYPIPGTRFVPYAGAGAGGAATMFDTDGLSRPVPGGSVTLYGSETDFVFAWQWFAGVRVELDNRMFIGLGYRYLHADASTFSFGSCCYGAPEFDLGLSSHESHMALITLGMRF